MMEADADKGLSTPSSFPYDRADKMKVELDKKALFALASDSRMEILKALQPQRRTVAQLADQLGIDKAAVHRHLKKLEEGSWLPVMRNTVSSIMASPGRPGT
jgi:DNA-binding MarR family transcriptional regulator